MLADNKVTPNESIPDKDKKTITEVIYYLDTMGYTKKIEWLPKDFKVYDDFFKTFGFKEYYGPEENVVEEPIFVNLNPSTPISITGYDTFVQTNISAYDQQRNQIICNLEKDGKTYSLVKDFNKNRFEIKLKGENGSDLFTFNTKDILDKFENFQSTKGEISAKEATFTAENDHAKLTIVVQNLNIEKRNNQYDASFYVFVHMK